MPEPPHRTVTIVEVIEGHGVVRRYSFEVAHKSARDAKLHCTHMLKAEAEAEERFGADDVSGLD